MPEDMSVRMSDAVPAAVENINMMLYRSICARQDQGLDPATFFHPGELMGHIIKPANQISVADNLEELIHKMPRRVQTEHHAAQEALMSIYRVIHLKKSKRFLDGHLPEIATLMRMSTRTAPLSEDQLAQLRTRKNWQRICSSIARSMVERANRDVQELDVPLFCLQAADKDIPEKTRT